MQTLKKVMNIFGIIAASILSVFLVITLVATPVISASSSFFQARNIRKVLTSIDYSKLVTSEMGIDSTEGIPALGNSLVEQLMDTEMMEEVIEMCINNVFDVMEGKSEKDGLTTEDIQAVSEKHLDELEGILKGYLGDTLSLPDETLKKMARQIAKEYSGLIAQILPSTEELGFNSDVINLISNLRNGTYFWITFVMAVVLTILVMLCQVMKFKGFMWISIGYYVAAVSSFILSFVIKAFDVSLLIGDVSIGVSIAQAMNGIIATEMLKGAGIMALLGIIFTVVFVVGRKMFRNKNAALQGEGDL